MSMPAQAPPSLRGTAEALPPFSLRLAYKWAIRIAAVAWLLFAAALLTTLAVKVGNQLQQVLFGAVIGKLTDSMKDGPAKGGTPPPTATPPAGATPGAAQAGAQPAAEARGGLDGLLNALVPDNLQTAVIVLLVVVAIVLALTLLENAFKSFADSRMLIRLQSSLHDKLLGLGAEWHAGRDTNASVALVTQFARGGQPALMEVLRQPLTQGISVITGVLLLMASLGQLPSTPIEVQIAGGAILLAVPLFAWWMSRKVRAALEETIAADQQLMNEAGNSFAQPADIVLLDAQPQRSRTFGAAVRAAALANLRRNIRSDTLNDLLGELPTILQGLFLLYGVLVLVSREGNVSGAAVGAIVAVYGLVPQVVLPLLSLINFFTGLSSQWPMLAKVGAALDAEPTLKEARDPQAWPGGQPQIAFTGVSFRYTPERPLVLNALDYRFDTGKVTGIVGDPGTGKSTILQLLSRSRDPEAGAVTVGGVPLADMRLAEVRKHVVVVSQFPAYLTGTIRDNLLLGRGDASDAELLEAARRTGLVQSFEQEGKPFLLDDVMLRESGKGGLSGGQRRLMAVTRALLRQPTLLLLDEPSVGIGAKYLETTVAALRTTSAGVTTVLVEHDLDLVGALADTVCVLAGGRFVQIGPPRALAEVPGPYRTLLETRRRIAGTTREMDVQSFPAPRIGASAGAFQAMQAPPDGVPMNGPFNQDGLPPDGPPPMLPSGGMAVSPLSGKKAFR